MEKKGMKKSFVLVDINNIGDGATLVALPYPCQSCNGSAIGQFSPSHNANEFRALSDAIRQPVQPICHHSYSPNEPALHSG
jgi:hypothetical protein